MPVVRSQNAPADAPDAAAEDAGAAEAALQRILQLRVPIIVRLAHRKLPLKEVLRMAHGSILELECSSGSALHLMVNNQVVGEGEAVKVGENFGLRLTAVGDLSDRISSLGG
jgi:flagellar motor switch protein FliN/FliY